MLNPDNLTDSDSDDIGGGTGCNFFFLMGNYTCNNSGYRSCREAVLNLGYAYPLGHPNHPRRYYC